MRKNLTCSTVSPASFSMIGQAFGPWIWKRCAARWKRMPSPMTPPSGDVGTNCLAMSTWNFAKLLMPVSDSSLSASGPEMNKLIM
jgi:hypothetical protein